MKNKTLETIKSELLAEFNEKFPDGGDGFGADFDGIKSFLSSAIDRVAGETVEATRAERPFLANVDPLPKFIESGKIETMSKSDNYKAGFNDSGIEVELNQSLKRDEWLGRGK